MGMDKIPQLVEKTRKANGMTQEGLARLIGDIMKPVKDFSTQTIRNWERDRYLPDFFMAFYLANQNYHPCPDWLRELAQEIVRIERETLSNNHA